MRDYHNRMWLSSLSLTESRALLCVLLILDFPKVSLELVNLVGVYRVRFVFLKNFSGMRAFVSNMQK